MFRLLLVVLGFTFLGVQLVAAREVAHNHAGISVASVAVALVGLAIVYFSGRSRWFLLPIAAVFTGFGILLFQEDIFRRGYGSVSLETRCVFALGLALAVAYLITRASWKKQKVSSPAAGQQAR